MATHVDIDVGPLGKTSGLAYHAVGDRAKVTLVLAHGAGAPQQSRFMTEFAGGLATRGVDVLTFNFLYTEARRKLPDRPPTLEACYLAVIGLARSYAPFEGNVVFIGGKSMGGRIATHIAALPTPGELGGVVLLGYPLHPPGKPQQLRTAHLPNIRVPMLFVQGAKDPFGTPDELRPVLEGLAVPTTLHVVDNGDHSLAPPERGPITVETVYGEVQDLIANWGRRTRSCRLSLTKP